MEPPQAGPRPLPARLSWCLGCLLISTTLLACGDGKAEPAPEKAPTQAAAKAVGNEAADLAAVDLAAAALGPGWVIWESNELGPARIFGRPLDGAPARVLSRAENGREHCCAQLAPDGLSFVYLSLPPAMARYPASGATGELRLHQLASGEERTLVAAARTYFEHRAVVFRDAGRLLYIDDQGRSSELELASGQSRPLTAAGQPAHGFLLDPLLAFATTGTPSFSLYDAQAGKILPRPILGGCQPYFTGDGKFGFFVAGAGGPIRLIDLATRKTKELLRKGDARLPADRRYLYFPMISRDNSLLAWGASDGSHDHFSADYDIFLAELDPASLQLAGPPLRVTRTPFAERFPDVWAPVGARPLKVALAPPTPVASPQSLAVPGEVLAFRGGDHTNLVVDGASGGEASTVFEPRGRAFFDRNYALELRGGSFVADLGTMERLLAGVQETNELSLELFFVAEAAAPRSVLFTFSSGRGGRRNFTLALQNGRLQLQLLTESNSGSAGREPVVDLGAVTVGQPQHLLLTYAPGELIVYRDGRETLRSQDWREGFFPWQKLPLLFGNEWEADEAFSGRILRAAVLNRVLEPGEVAARAAEAAAELAARPALPLLRVKARLLGRSRTPRLDEIAPYRQALAVYEYELRELLAGSAPEGVGGKVRVVHRVLEDGEALPITRVAEGRELIFTLEGFAEQPQLESLFLSDQLPATDQALYFSPDLDLK